MALRNQPYIPLYVQDFLTDEKLNECSASSQGVYIKIMCILHKQEAYGVILLKQKDKQTTNTIQNFACKFAKLLPFSYDVLFLALTELIEEHVLTIEDDKLFQKRMVKDNSISETRSKAGKRGGGNPNFVKTKLQTNSKQNPEYEYEYEYEFKNDNIDIVSLKQNFDFSFLEAKEIFNGEIECEFLNWALHLQNQKKNLTQQMLELQYSNLMRCSANNKAKAIHLIKKSILKGWSDIYPEEEKKEIDFDIKSIIGNSTNLEYVDFINYIEKYAVFLNRMKEPLQEEQFIRLVNLKGLKTLKTIVVDLHNSQVYYEKLANTFLTINKFIERNEKK